MIKRCSDPRHKQYPNYGGRGITVCARWMDVSAFVADVEAELGQRPPGKKNGRALATLDRRDNDGNYEPGNIRWASNSQQVLNRRSNGLRGKPGNNPHPADRDRLGRFARSG